MVDRLRKVLQRPQAAIMGIVNTTPDSFSDGGSFLLRDKALRHALMLIEEGADIVDVGGESTRPGAKTVGLQEEIDRVIPVIEQLVAESATPVSIDSYKPEVMKAALAAGASMVNDVNGLRSESAICVVAEAGAVACIMHMLGRPRDMQVEPQYSNVVREVSEFLQSQVVRCLDAGIPKTDLLLDPGIGFGKTLEHNLALLQSVPKLCGDLACNILIGVSRKSMINDVLNRTVDKRLPASVGLAVQSVINGAKVVRVHDVRATYDAVRSVEAVIKV